MSGINDRERAEEGSFAHDQEIAFKITVRRNKLAGLWAAEQMKLTGEDAQAYASKLIEAGVDTTDDNVTKQAIVADFAAKGVDISEHRVSKKLDELKAEATQQVMTEG